METEWKEVISKQRPELCKLIDTDGDFIDQLESLKVFNHRNCQSFTSKTGRYNQVSAILSALLKRPYEDYLKFCEALRLSHQSHIIDECLTLNPSHPSITNISSSNHTSSDARPADVNTENPLRNTWKDLIRHNYTRLVSEIDPDHGLFNYLVSKEVIVEWMKDTFKLEGRSNRAAAILDHLVLKRPFDDFMKFCDALNETNQGHIVTKYLTVGHNVQGADHSDCRADVVLLQNAAALASELQESYGFTNFDWKRVFIEIRSYLVDQIDASNDFINDLLGFGVFNEMSYEACQDKDEYLRVEFILDYMRRRPDDDFLRFCCALKKTNQEHVLKYIIEHKIEKSVRLIQEPVFHRQEEARTGCGDDEMEIGRKVSPKRQNSLITQATDDVEMPEVGVLQNPTLQNERNNIVVRPFETQIEDRSCVPKGVQPVGEDSAQRETQHPVIPNPVAPVTHVQHYQPTPEPIREENDKGPIDITKINVKNCDVEFYRRHRRDAYPMFRQRRGKCYIINVKYVQGMSHRHGTEVDAKLLSDLFSQLHFDVKSLHDPTAEEIKRKLATIGADETLKNDQCLVMFVLSHGETKNYQDFIFGSDGEPVIVEEILRSLTDARCPNLINKPRLVFFQACRGGSYQSQSQTQTDAPPVYKDILVGYPTQREYRSFRNTQLGSWYINALIQVFQQRACNTSLSDMLSLVSGKVGRWLSETSDPESNQKGQTATHQSHLQKLFYFFPGITEENP